VSDRIQQLAQRVADLDGAPVTTHPGVLDDVHRGLVSELDRLAGDVAGNPRAAVTGSASGRR